MIFLAYLNIGKKEQLFWHKNVFPKRNLVSFNKNFFNRILMIEKMKKKLSLFFLRFFQENVSGENIPESARHRFLSSERKFWNVSLIWSTNNHGLLSLEFMAFRHFPPISKNGRKIIEDSSRAFSTNTCQLHDAGKTARTQQNCTFWNINKW